jgi:hypothetical protein
MFYSNQLRVQKVLLLRHSIFPFLYSFILFLFLFFLFFFFVGCSQENSSTRGSSGSFVLRGKLNLISQAFYGGGAGSPTNVWFKVHRVWLSLSSNCMNPIAVNPTNFTPAYNDLSTSPVLFRGSIQLGNFQCMIIEMEDVFLFKTGKIDNSTIHEGCKDDTSYGQDLYADSAEVFYDYGNNTIINGSGDRTRANALKNEASIKTYAGTQTITYFISTQNAATVRAQYPNLHESSEGDHQWFSINKGINIANANPIEVNFVYDFTNALDGTIPDDEEGSLCVCENPVLTFSVN